jgi:hypothetical protein
VKVILGLLFPPSILLLDFKRPAATTISAAGAGAEENAKRTTGPEGNGGQMDYPNDGPMDGAEGTQEHDNLLTIGRGRINGASGSNGKHPPPSQTRAFTNDTTTTTRNPPKLATNLGHWCHGAWCKCQLFYSAPITSFWVWSISFMAFMLALIYVLLVEFPREVPLLEWLLFSYVLAFAMEHFRKVIEHNYTIKQRVINNGYEMHFFGINE